MGEYVRKWCYNGVMRRGRMEGRARMRLTTIPIHQTFSSLNNSAKRDLQGRKNLGAL
jgi:hypothetical protein